MLLMGAAEIHRRQMDGIECRPPSTRGRAARIRSTSSPQPPWKPRIGLRQVALNRVYRRAPPQIIECRRSQAARPTGQVTGAVSSASVEAISSSSSIGSRLSRSILLMKVTMGMSRSRQISNSFRVRASMPLAASITITAEIDRGERAVGILRKILVARRVEQFEHAAGVLEGHHRGDHRDAALALDAHPVGASAAPSPLARTFPASWMAPPARSKCSVSVVLPASGWDMIANVRRRAISVAASVIGCPCEGAGEISTGAACVI